MFSFGASKGSQALNEIKSVFGFSEKSSKENTLKYSETNAGANQSTHTAIHFTESTDVEAKASSRPKKLSLGGVTSPDERRIASVDVRKLKHSSLDDQDAFDAELSPPDSQKRNSLGSTAAYSPLIAKKDVASHPFSIPPTYPATVNLSHSHGSVDLSHLDLAQYTNQEEDQEEKKKRRSTGISLGEIDVVLRFVVGEELLAVTVHDTNKFLLPSASVIGERWSLSPVVTMSLLPDKRRFIDCKQQVELRDDTSGFLNLKCSEMAEKTLRLTVFDSKRRHNHLAVGHALIPLKEMDPLGRTSTFSRPLTCYSEPAGFNRGKVELKVTWVVSAQKLELTIGRAYNLKSPRGVLGRDFFFKLFVYIRDVEVKTFKTAATRASPDVDFKEKVIIPMTLEQLKESSFVFCLYAKHLVRLTITSELVGLTVIGPYMANRCKAMSQWEKMIMSPFEEVDEIHTLSL